MKRLLVLVIVGYLCSIIGGCASPQRLGMVSENGMDPQFGSVVERNIFVDSSQFKNKTTKLSIRNSSGDSRYRLNSFASDLNSAIAAKGYIPTQEDSFGIKVDVNVLYSGHIQSNLTSTYGFLGAAAGGVIGDRSNAKSGTVVGVLLGATVGAIAGSYITDDTYIVIVEVSIGISDSVDAPRSNNKVVTFGSSPALQEERLTSNCTPFRQVVRSRIAVYGGGRNTSSQQVSDQVRHRLIGIVGDSL